MKIKLLRKIIPIVILISVPMIILIKNYSHQKGFLSLILFGQRFKAVSLKEIQKINPPTESKSGYDGQFYAQIALDPSLNNNELQTALDNPVYRSRRIGLPFLAFCLGFGKPVWILQIYALLNFIFWLILLAAFCKFIGFQHTRNFLLAIAIFWSTGTLTSIARALPDLPAAVLSILVIFFIDTNWIMAASFLGIAILFKETSAFSLLAVTWPDEKISFAFKRFLASCLIMFVPVILWFLYIHYQLPGGTEFKSNQFALPFSEILSKLNKSFIQIISEFSKNPKLGRIFYFSFELICPLSILVQSIYFIIKPRITSKIWKLGIGFAILLYFLGDRIWAEQYGYCRILLPLTISFNLLIHKYENKNTSFTFWYILGNTGMMWLCLKTFKCME